MKIELKRAFETERLKKSLAAVSEVEGHVLNESIQSPSFRVIGDLSKVNANYLYVPELNSYYYITSIDSVGVNAWTVNCRRDPLMTFYDEILGCRGIVERQEKKYNLYLEDSSVKSYADPLITVSQFPSNLSGSYTYLVAVG